MAKPHHKSARRDPKTGVVIPHKPKWHQQLGGFIVFAALRVLLATVRTRLVDPTGFMASRAHGPVIYCFWHNRLGTCMAVNARYCRPHNPTGLAALVSASKDGAFLSRVLELFGVQPVRGSSSRRGAQAMLELTTWGERGYDLAITPDGPRGPCYQIADGVMSLAQLTGLPIVPLAFNLNWKICVKSWDRFQIPLPFASCEVMVGKPSSIPRSATDEQREQLRQELGKQLREISRD
jgi:lysophospholipid acyltransferase (LPLAT)-like uncharacterized protein